MPVPEYKPTDSCAHCGLQRRTRELEQKGLIIRLCDDCYWGRESATPASGQDEQNEKTAPAA